MAKINKKRIKNTAFCTKTGKKTNFLKIKKDAQKAPFKS